MAGAIARARADLEAGRAWKARDRLTGLLAHRQDDEVLDILATTHLTMGSLPDAGALWFVTGRSDALAEEAVAAWRERYGSEEARWYSIPAPIRRGERLGDLRALRQAEPSKTAGRRDLPPPDRARWGAYVAGAGCLLVVLWIAVAVVVGSIALVRAILG